MPKRKFELIEGASAKFWHVEQKAKNQTVWYGRIGTDGQTKTKTFESAALAKASVEKLIAQKMKKGYVEGSGSKKTDAMKRLSKNKSNLAKDKVAKLNLKKFFRPLSKKDLKGHPKLTAASLKKVEKQRAIKFPAAMVSLMKIQNGGYLEEPDFKIGRSEYSVEEIWPISVFGIEELVPQFADHLEMARGRLAKPELIFPFCGDGHYFYALDYRKTGPKKEPHVIYLDIEGKITCKKIADSFDDFLAGWQQPDMGQKKSIDIDAVDPDMIIGTSTQKSIMKDERRKSRAVCRNWLCVNGDQVEYFSMYGRQYMKRDGKWNEELEWENWTKNSIKLSDIFALELSGAKIYINPFQMRATKGKAPPKPANSVTCQDMSREGIGKPWKNKRASRTFVFPAVEIDSKIRKSCWKKLKAAIKAETGAAVKTKII